MFDKEPYYTEKIEAYLRNELTEHEKANFEQLLRQDPLLYNEFKLQQEIMGSIQAYRKNQLKQRLESIDVSDLVNAGPNTGTIAGLFLSGAALLGIVGWLTWGDIIQTGEKRQEKSVVASKNQSHGLTDAPKSDKTQETNPFEANTPLNDVPAEAGNTGTVPVEEEPKQVPVEEEPKQVPAKIKRVSPDNHIDKAPIADANAQAEKKPLVEETPRKAENGDGNEKVTIKPGLEPAARLNITDNTNSKLKLHYYYLNNQIALLGFDQPYVLLEIQPENATYLYYDGNFYHLDTAKHQPSPIQEVLVTDPQLIDKLNERLNNRK